MYTNDRDEEVTILKKLWTSQSVICPKCGKDLNTGSCSCEKEIDPRLAALKQLLDN